MTCLRNRGINYQIRYRYVPPITLIIDYASPPSKEKQCHVHNLSFSLLTLPTPPFFNHPPYSSLLQSPSPCHDKEWLKFKTLIMRPVPVGVVMFSDIHDFLGTGHHVQGRIVVTAVP